jgi:hypothetical protein
LPESVIYRVTNPYVSLVAVRMRSRALILLDADRRRVVQDSMLDTREKRFRAIRDTSQFE